MLVAIYCIFRPNSCVSELARSFMRNEEIRGVAA
jgi:hypothetical protein